MTDKPELLRLAKLLTGSSDIDILIEAAGKLDRYANASEIANTYKHPLLMSVQADLVDFAATLAIHHPTRGAVPFVLYDFQRKAFNQLQFSNHRTVAIASARQMGWSAMIAAYALHYALNNDNTTQLIMAPRFHSAWELGGRLRFMAQSRPDVAIKSHNKADIEFANGSRILFRAAGTEACCGVSLNKAFIMDAAFVSHKRLNDLIMTITPALVSHAGQLIMQSTPNMADDPFHEFYKNAELQIHQTWDLHPDRDDAWKAPFLASMGQDKWDREFEAKFI